MKTTIRFLTSFILLTCFILPHVSPLFAADISGTVTIVSKIRKVQQGKKKKKGSYGDDYLSKKSDNGSLGKIDEAQQVVVFIVEAKKNSSASSSRPKMTQNKRTFIPHVLPVLTGSSVDFPNLDKIYHAVYSDSAAKKIELPEYANGDSRTVKFDKEGIVELFCGIHTNMNAYILVLQNPFFSTADASHKYVIKNIPPGKYILRAWHPRLEAKDQEVTVPASGTLTVDVKL